MENHDNIQKAKFFPNRLLETLCKALPPYECDLHGYSCKDAADLMQKAFSHDLPDNVVYTFILGAGRHSTKKYRVELSKACRKGLTAAGIAEDRHASQGAIGKFKCIEDNDHGLCMVRVYPKTRLLLETRECPETADENNAMEALQNPHDSIGNLCMRCEPPRLEAISMYCLTELLSELLLFLQEGLQGVHHSRNAVEPPGIDNSAVANLDSFRGAWKDAFGQWRRRVSDAIFLSQSEVAACHRLLNQMEQSPMSDPKSMTELFDLRKLLEARPMEELDDACLLRETGAKTKPLRAQHRKATASWSPAFSSTSSINVHAAAAVQGNFAASQQSIEPLQEMLAGMCNDGPISLLQLQNNYFEWTGERLDKIAKLFGHSVLSLLRSIPNCEVGLGDDSFLLHFQYADVPRQGLSNVSQNDAAPMEFRRNSATAQNCKVVCFDWDAKAMGDDYMSLCVGEKILDAGLLEEGWAFGEVLDLSGEAIRSGWYPPDFVRSMEANGDASANSVAPTSSRAHVDSHVTHQVGAASSDRSSAAIWQTFPDSAEKERPWTIVGRSRQKTICGIGCLLLWSRLPLLSLISVCIK